MMEDVSVTGRYSANRLTCAIRRIMYSLYLTGMALESDVVNACEMPESRCRCGTGRAQSRCRCGRGGPIPV